LAKLQEATNGAPEIKFLQFQFAMQQGNFADAEALVNELKKAYPSQIKVAMAEVELLAAQERKDEVISVLNKTIEEFPQVIGPVRYLAILAAQQGEYEKCDAIIKDALTRIEQPVAHRELGLLLAQIYTRRGQKDNVYQLLNSLVKKLY
jgi:tetratricopeptide (TPR) repeat protein